MAERADAEGSAPVEELAKAHGGDAFRQALVAGADHAAATRAAIHALVIGAVKGGAAAERAAILGLARTWALERPALGTAPVRDGDEVAGAFWALPEPIRSVLWCTEALGLRGDDLERVVPGGGRVAAMARGRLRRSVCRERRSAGRAPECAPGADVVGAVLAGRAAGAKRTSVQEHAAACEDCAQLLAALRQPMESVERTLPSAPDLSVAARRAWRDHVGAPRHPVAERGRRAAAAATAHRRPLAAVLTVMTAATFGGAAGQLATSDLPAPTAPLVAAAPVVPPPRPKAPRVTAPPQAIIPPLAADAVLDPGLARIVTSDLAAVTPATVPAPAPPVPAAAPQPLPPPPPDPIAEPPPAVSQTTTIDLGVPPLTTLPVSIEIGPCTTIKVGPLRVTLPCDR